jgi:hypothetical protein
MLFFLMGLKQYFLSGTVLLQAIYSHKGANLNLQVTQQMYQMMTETYLNLQYHMPYTARQQFLSHVGVVCTWHAQCSTKF